MQLPWINCELRTIPQYFSVFVQGLLAYSSLSVVFTGGVGKNGSTVAVSKSQMT